MSTTNDAQTAPLYASVDIGTNSVLLLIARQSPPSNALVAVDERLYITRLGQDVDKTKTLAIEAIERTLAAIDELAAIIAGHGVEKLAIVGTAALRDAKNSAAFVEAVERKLGAKLQIIAGEKEALLTVQGVRSGVAVKPLSVVFDVGGGSTEIVQLDSDGRIATQKSLAVGAVRMTERFVKSDPPTGEQIAAARNEIRAQLGPICRPLAERCRQLIGVAGTVTTLVTIDGAIEPYDSKRVNNTTLSAARIDELFQRLASLALAERKAIVGLHERRADVMVIGALIVQTVMQLLGMDQLLVCDRGVRWGALYDLLSARGLQPPDSQ
jgi:exopolyphosphatase/guanosine-5'-triphosphate,3'-diphosphate pyrophosphatase